MNSNKELVSNSRGRKIYKKVKAYNEKWGGSSNPLVYYGIAFLIFCGAIFLAYPTLFVMKLSLIPIEGKVDITRTHVIYQEIYSDNEKKTVQSTKSILPIRLKGNNTNFELMKNIGYDVVNPKYESIITALLKSKKATVWIKKSEQNSSKPRVYQIDAGDKTVLSIFDSIKELLLLTLFFILLSIMIFALGFWFRKHQKFDELEGSD